MDIKKFRIFLNAVSTQDFAETGRDMFISRSAVLQQITKLEQDLGVRLFDRTTHNIRPTEAGKELIPLANRLVQTEDKIIQVMHNHSNTLTIGTIYLQKPEIFTKYWNKSGSNFPDINIKFKEIQDIKRINRKVDVIEYYEISKFMDNAFKFKVMRKEQIIVGIPETNPLVNKKELTIYDILPYEIAIERKGVSEMGDKVMNYIVENFPKIKLKSYGVYNSSFFTTAQFKQQLIIASSGMAQYMHPYKVKPLKLGIDIHALYGFYYRKRPSKSVIRFLNSL